MPAAYPSFLRPMLRASKSRSQPAKFSIAEPRRGTGYVREIGTDTPVFWDFQFRFKRSDALVFKLWFNTVINGGVDEFTMPILTEFGLLEHTCRFLPDNLLDCTESGEIITYKAKVMARAEVIPDGYTEVGPLIAALEDWTTWVEMLDQAINVEMPI